jgi:hypothetical protein
MFARIRASMHIKPKVYDTRQPAAPVVVTKVAKPPREHKSKIFRRLILAALAGGTRTSEKLARLCGTDPNDKTFARARIALEADGLMVCLGRRGRQQLYALNSLPGADVASSRQNADPGVAA